MCCHPQEVSRSYPQGLSHSDINTIFSWAVISLELGSYSMWVVSHFLGEGHFWVTKSCQIYIGCLGCDVLSSGHKLAFSSPSEMKEVHIIDMDDRGLHSHCPGGLSYRICPVLGGGITDESLMLVLNWTDDPEYNYDETISRYALDYIVLVHLSIWKGIPLL